MNNFLISALEARNIEFDKINTCEKLFIYATKMICIAASKQTTQTTIAVDFPVTEEDKTFVETTFKNKGYEFMWLDRKKYSTFFTSWKM